MLQKIRDHSGNIIVKGILSLIGASFVVGGMIGVFHMMSELPPVAKIGRTKVLFLDFQEAYRRALMKARRGDSPLSKDQAETVLPAQVVDELVVQQILRLEPDRMRLVIPDSVIMDQIHALCSVEGRYDPERLRQILAAMSMTPAQLMDYLRRNMKIQQLLLPTAQGTQLNAPYADMLTRTLGHRKNFDFVLIPWERVPEPNPTDEDLDEWLNKNTSQYEVPDQRAVEVIALSHSALGKRLPLTEDEIRQEYEARKAEWTIPAERETYKVEFTSEADAKDAKKLFGGKPMTKRDVAKAIPGVELEPVDVQTLPNDEAEMVQGLGDGEAVGPLQRDGKWVIYCVLKFTPEQVRPFEDVKADVEQGLRLRRIEAEIGAIKDQIEDALAGGKTVEEAAKDYPLTAVSIQGMTMENAAEKISEAFGEQGTNETERSEVVRFVTDQAFQLEKGEESAFEDVAGQSLIVRVTNVVSRHLPERKQIADRVRADWIQHRRQQSAHELAFTLFGKVSSAEEWEKAVRKSGLKAKHVVASRLDCERGTSDLNQSFSDRSINQLLLTASNSVILVETAEKQIAAVFVGATQSDAISALDSQKLEQMERIREMLNRNRSEELSQLLVDSIQATYKIKLNQKSIDRAVRSNNHGEGEA